MGHRTKGTGVKRAATDGPEGQPSPDKSAAPEDSARGLVIGRGRTFLLCLGLTLAVLAAYANHFRNEFHFDDFHTIVNNLFITDLHNVPRFFGDAALFSTMAVNATYRPVTSTSLAIDYWLGHGYVPFFFHLSTFCWFALQLILMFFLFRRIMDRANPHPSNTWTALAAAACYGLHPANAETVNYIIQRGDLYNTLGAVASLLWFAAYPAQRKYGWYLLPALAAYFAKPPALIYPFLLLAYVFLIEQDGAFSATNRAENRKAWSAAFRAALPALAVTAAAAILIAKMTPPAFQAGGDPVLYRLTQPWVMLHYFKSFFLPTELSADTDWTYVSGAFSGEALAGYLFVIALAAAVVYTSRRRQTRPIAFGLVWFFVTLLPTSLLPLADVTNDHRMFFPFVGLALPVFWSLRLLLFRKTALLSGNWAWMRGAAVALAVVLSAEAAGTHARNDVWHTEESLWHDVTIKSPNNGRGWSSYGASLVNKQDFAGALPLLERAAQLRPYDSVVQLNLGVSYDGLGRDAEAERHFQQALSVAPGMPDPPLYYARWLESKHRLEEAQAQAEAAVRANPRAFFARYLLLKIYSQQKNRQAYDNLMQDSLRLAYNDETARRYLEERATAEKRSGAGAPAPPPSATPPPGSPEALLNLSAKYCNDGAYEGCIETAKKALELRPGYAEAYNNMAAGYSSLEKWDEAIKAASEAIRLKPDYPLARKNLDWAVTHKQAQKGGR
jgi:Flp pilus assembly protein TadD